MNKCNNVLFALSIMAFSSYGYAENINILIKNRTIMPVSVEFPSMGTASIEPRNEITFNYSGDAYATAVSCRMVYQGTACTFPKNDLGSETLLVDTGCELSGDPWTRNLTLTCGRAY